MLMSYVLDAGNDTPWHGRAVRTLLGHKPIAFKDVAGTGKGTSTFDWSISNAPPHYAAEDADITLRLWLVLKPRLRGRRA